MAEPRTIDDLRECYDCDFLEQHGRFERVTTSPEESAWYCTDCGGLDVEPGEDICHTCDDED